MILTQQLEKTTKQKKLKATVPSIKTYSEHKKNVVKQHKTNHFKHT